MPTCRRHYPGGNAGGAKVVPPVSSRLRPSPSLCWVGYHITRFEACSAFTHVTACLLAESLKRPFPSKASTVSLPPLPLRLLPAGTTSCRVGFAPTEKSRLGTAHKGDGHHCRNGPKGAPHNGARPLFRIGSKARNRSLATTLAETRSKIRCALITQPLNEFLAQGTARMLLEKMT